MEMPMEWFFCTLDAQEASRGELPARRGGPWNASAWTALIIYAEGHWCVWRGKHPWGLSIDPHVEYGPDGRTFRIVCSKEVFWVRGDHADRAAAMTDEEVTELRRAAAVHRWLRQQSH